MLKVKKTILKNVTSSVWWLLGPPGKTYPRNRPEIEQNVSMICKIVNVLIIKNQWILSTSFNFE